MSGFFSAFGERRLPLLPILKKLVCGLLVWLKNQKIHLDSTLSKDYNATVACFSRFCGKPRACRKASHLLKIVVSSGAFIFSIFVSHIGGKHVGFQSFC